MVAADGLEQRRLARAIRADHGGEGARCRREGNLVQDLPIAQGNGKSADIDHRDHQAKAARLRSKIQRKKGPPTAAVTMPMGNSAGATINRLTASATNRNDAPSKAVAGSR